MWQGGGDVVRLCGTLRPGNKAKLGCVADAHVFEHEMQNLDESLFLSYEFAFMFIF